MSYEYYGDIKSRKDLEIVMLNTQLQDLLKYAPVPRTKMALELKELHTKFKVQSPFWLDGFVEDPNKWTEVAIRLDLGQILPPLDALNAELGTDFKSFDDLKDSLGIAPTVQEVKASEEDEFIARALKGED